MTKSLTEHCPGLVSPAFRTILVLALWLPGGLTYPMFKEELPNGDHVPHPCKPNFLWHGVGHLISQGGGPRNPFGEDFANNGNVVGL